MDDSVIYVKTVAGDEAVRERTRLVQRNLRMVLILIDGHLSVGELKSKVENEAILKSTLAELEELDLIQTTARRQERLDNAQARSEEPPEHVGRNSASVSNLVSLSAATAQGMAIGMVPEAPRHNEYDMAVGVPKVAEPRDQGANRQSNRSLQSRIPAPWDSAPPRLKGILEFFRRPRPKLKSTKYSHADRKFEQAYDDEPAPVVKVKSVRTGPRIFVIWPIRAVMVLFLLAGALALVLTFTSLEPYRQRIELAAVEVLQSPVKIESVRFSFTPYPNVTLSHVAVGGSTPYASVETVRLVPEPASLFSDSPGLGRVQLNGLHLNAASLDRAAKWFAAASRNFAIRHLTVENFSVELGSVSFNGLSGEGIFRPEGVVSKFVLISSDRSVRVEAEPYGSLFRVHLTGTSLQLPVRPHFMFSAVDVIGEMTPMQWRVSDFAAQFADGIVIGNGSYDWSDGSRLSGNLTLKHGNLAKLFDVLNPNMSLEGDFDAQGHFQAQAASPRELFDGMRFDATWRATHAVLNHFDLVEAARSGGLEPIRSGSTRVDQFSGKLHCDAKACQAADLEMLSGLMRANGQIHLSRTEGKIDGLIRVELRGSANAVNASVVIGGTADHPELLRR